jgi:hypothetical protein
MSRGSDAARVALMLTLLAGLAVVAVPLVLDSGEPAGEGVGRPAGEEDVAAGAANGDGAGPPRERVGPSQDEPAAAPARDPGTQVRLGREVAWVDGTAVPYSPASAFLLPGERMHLDVRPDPARQRLVRADSAGTLERLDGDTWAWTAPAEPGVHTLRVVENGRETAFLLRVFVQVPATEISGGSLDGYRIGSYPTVPLRGDTSYMSPDGFVRVTEENRDLRVSPRFRLRHFETKQGGGFPRYLALQRRLLTKLELLVDALVERGYPVRSLHVMSGYRTPAYNRAIGNTTSYSRHLWGDAADVFVDEDGDGWMDDLDGDGAVTVEDARVLYEIVDSLDAAIDTRRLAGGLSLYGPRSHRGPFVHMDARGAPARW